MCVCVCVWVGVCVRERETPFELMSLYFHLLQRLVLRGRPIHCKFQCMIQVAMVVLLVVAVCIHHDFMQLCIIDVCVHVCTYVVMSDHARMCVCMHAWMNVRRYHTCMFVCMT